MIRRDDIEIRDQQHLMDAEGSHDEQPTPTQIAGILSSEGWICTDLDIWFDTIQGLWKWSCAIERI